MMIHHDTNFGYEWFRSYPLEKAKSQNTRTTEHDDSSILPSTPPPPTPHPLLCGVKQTHTQCYRGTEIGERGWRCHPSGRWLAMLHYKESTTIAELSNAPDPEGRVQPLTSICVAQCSAGCCSWQGVTCPAGSGTTGTCCCGLQWLKRKPAWSVSLSIRWCQPLN